MALEDFFNQNEIENAKKYISEFHGDVLLNETLSGPKAILLIVYMLCNNTKLSRVPIKNVKSFFIQSGRNEIEFSKTIYELTSRGKVSLVRKDEGGNLSLTFNGLEKIKEMLENEK